MHNDNKTIDEFISPDDPMYRYVTALYDFMKNEVDYSYMLNGQWGSGKTFFVNHLLTEIFKKVDIEIIHISLFGKTSIDQINIDIYAHVLLHMQNKELKKILTTSFHKVETSGNTKLSFLASGLSMLGAYGFRKKKSGKDHKSKMLLVFDDVERCNEEYRIDIIGNICSQYIEQGVHVLFVSDETKIESDKYNEIKEKFIRTTINFRYDDLSTFIASIINSKPDTPISCLFKNDKKAFLEVVDKVRNVENLRTWLSSFDYYNMTVKKCEYNEDYPFLLQLFLIIFLTTHYMKTDRSLFDTNPVMLDDEKDTLEKCIQNEFGISSIWLYQGREFRLQDQLYAGVYRFSRLSSIINLIETGFIDAQLIRSEMESCFPQGTAAEKALVKSYSIGSLSQEEMEECFIDILNGVSNKEFALEKLVDISRMFEEYEKVGYLNIYGDKFSNYQDVFIKAIDNLTSDEIGNFFEKSDLGRCPYDEYKKKKNFLDDSLSKLNKTYSNPNDENKKFSKFVENIGDYKLSEITWGKRFGLIEKIEKYGLFPSFLKFRCKDIDWISLYLIDISKSVNSGDVFFSEVEPLTKLKSYLEKELVNLSPSKQKVDLQMLINMIETTIKKLEYSRSK